MPFKSHLSEFFNFCSVKNGNDSAKRPYIPTQCGTTQKRSGCSLSAFSALLVHFTSTQSNMFSATFAVVQDSTIICIITISHCCSHHVIHRVLKSNTENTDCSTRIIRVKSLHSRIILFPNLHVLCSWEFEE